MNRKQKRKRATGYNNIVSVILYINVSKNATGIINRLLSNSLLLNRQYTINTN